MSFSFIPESYVAPAPSGGEFLKLPEDGKSIRFIPLSTLVSGWTYWDDNKQSYRSPVEFTDTPGLREGEKPKHFWMLHVLDLDDKAVKIVEITQVSVQRAIRKMVEDGDYNFTDGTNGFRISRKGKGKTDTQYTAVPTPVRPGEEKDAYDAVDRETLNDLNKFAFDKREPKSDITEVIPEVM